MVTQKAFWVSMRSNVNTMTGQKTVEPINMFNWQQRQAPARVGGLTVHTSPSWWMACLQGRSRQSNIHGRELHIYISGCKVQVKADVLKF